MTAAVRDKANLIGVILVHATVCVITNRSRNVERAAVVWFACWTSCYPNSGRAADPPNECLICHMRSANGWEVVRDVCGCASCSNCALIVATSCHVLLSSPHTLFIVLRSSQLLKRKRISGRKSTDSFSPSAKTSPSCGPTFHSSALPATSKHMKAAKSSFTTPDHLSTLLAEALVTAQTLVSRRGATIAQQTSPSLSQLHPMGL